MYELTVPKVQFPQRKQQHFHSWQLTNARSASRKEKKINLCRVRVCNISCCALLLWPQKWNTRDADAASEGVLTLNGTTTIQIFMASACTRISIHSRSLSHIRTCPSIRRLLFSYIIHAECARNVNMDFQANEGVCVLACSVMVAGIRELEYHALAILFFGKI